MSKLSYNEGTDSAVFSFDQSESFNLFLAPISFEEVKASKTLATVQVHCSDKQCNNVQCLQVQCSQVHCTQYRQCIYVYRYYNNCNCDCKCNCDCTCGDSDSDGY